MGALFFSRKPLRQGPRFRVVAFISLSFVLSSAYAGPDARKFRGFPGKVLFLIIHSRCGAAAFLAVMCTPAAVWLRPGPSGLSRPPAAVRLRSGLSGPSRPMPAMAFPGVPAAVL